MSVAALSTVQARMATIEQRFARRNELPATGATQLATPAPRFGAPSQVLGAGLVPEVDTARLRAPDTSGSYPELASFDATRLYATSSGFTTGGVATSGTTIGAVAPGTPFGDLFEQAGARHGVPPRLLAAVGWVESRYQVDAVSPDGAIGVMQIMPMTATELGVDPRDPVAAIDGAARLLAAHHARFGSWDLALAAYHSGAGAVSRAGNAAPPRAAEYVRRVHERLEVA